MLGSFYSAVSGVQGHLFSMGIVGNNIANVNTNSYKAGHATFREALVQTVRGASAPREGLGGQSAIQVGLGMDVASVTSNRGQGMLQNTGVVTDLGIDGEGYFVLSDGQTQSYTRAGNFMFDANGYLTSPGTGLIVQGWMANEAGQVLAGSQLSSIRLPFGERVPASSSTEVEFGYNLDAMATTSTAELESAGTTGITAATGTALNGAGGEHRITITGNNATASSALGANLAAPGALTGAELLSALGVTDASDFTITVDSGDPVQITGLTVGSTVNDLITAINERNIGVTASLDGGEVRLTRDYHGDGGVYNIDTSAAVAGNITRQLFGAAVGTTFTAANGTASTLEATDVFTPTGKNSTAPVTLTLTIDAETGLVDGISDLGGGGVTLSAQDGLAAGVAVISTEDTQHLTSILVYDSLGEEHALNMVFTRSATQNLWYWEATFDEGETVTGGRTGAIEFNSDGSFRSWVFDDGGEQLTLEPGTGADSMRISFWSGTASRFDGITQFSSPFTAKARAQDGYGMGSLTSISIDTSGKITGLFSNGLLKEMGQVVLAKFNNPDGLERIGGNLFQVSPNSGSTIIGAAGETVSASVVSKTLEMSNVDLSEEFVKMIVAQRGFQANARVISTGDEMLTDLINLKR